MSPPKISARGSVIIVSSNHLALWDRIRGVSSAMAHRKPEIQRTNACPSKPLSGMQNEVVHHSKTLNYWSILSIRIELERVPSRSIHLFPVLP